MTCAVCRTIEREGLDERQVNEELTDLYLGSNGRKLGTPALTAYFNTKILEKIFKEKSADKGMPLVKMSILHDTVRKVFDSKEVSTEDYELMTRVFEQYSLDVHSVRSRFTNRKSMWQHVKKCLNLETQLSTEEFLKKANKRIRYFRISLNSITKGAGKRGIGGEGTSFEPMLFVACRRCDRTYPIEEFLKEDFKCECAKEEGR